MDESIVYGPDPIHEWFNLTYASYLTIPRSVLQSMPTEWQERLVSLLEEMSAKCAEYDIDLPATTVAVRDARGRFMHDWLTDYQRGRRDIFAETETARKPQPETGNSE